jgi:prepilin-type processing-associated H-X9-DG protein
MTLTQSIIALSTTVLLSACIVIATPSHADVHLQKELVLDAQTLKMLNINAGAGSLSIVGRDGIDEITVKADIYTSSEEDAYELILSNSGHTAYLVARNSSHSGRTNITWGDGHRIDVEVIVPKTMKLDITDGSGEMAVTSINANVDIKDGSGE